MKKTNLILIFGLLAGLSSEFIKSAAAASDDYEMVSLADTINFEDPIGQITKKHLEELLTAAKKSEQDFQKFINAQLKPKELWKVLFKNGTLDKQDLNSFKNMNNKTAQELLKFAYDHVENNYNSHCRELILRKYTPENSLGQDAISLINKNNFINLIIAWTADELSFEIFKDHFIRTIDQSTQIESRLLEFYAKVLELQNRA